MKSALIFFRNLKSDFDGDYLKNVVSAFSHGGLDFDTVELLSDTDDLGFKRRITEFKDMFENVVIIGGDKVKFNLKQIIAQTFETVLIENETARTFLDAVIKENAIDYPDEFSVMPIEANVIPNVYGGFQGFILDATDLTLSVLPFDYKEIKIMCDKYVLPYLESKLGVKKTRLTLKYFGEKEKIEKTLRSLEGQTEEPFFWSVFEKNGDNTIDLLFDYETQESVKKEIIRQLVLVHKEDIYAESDQSLSQRLFDLLELRGVKLSTAESFTAGRVINEIIKNSGASKHVNEGVVCYSNESKEKRLKVKKDDLIREGAVSAVVAYQMAVGLLKDGADIAISTTGIAGPKSDDTAKPVGLCYIAVGMKDGVHTYKYKFNGTREEITERAKNTALFLAIKKLKLL